MLKVVHNIRMTIEFSLEKDDLLKVRIQWANNQIPKKISYSYKDGTACKILKIWNLKIRLLKFIWNLGFKGYSFFASYLEGHLVMICVALKVPFSYFPSTTTDKPS
jgi:hypothetical protein